MTFIVADRIKETSSTTGTGPITLTGAVAGFKTMASRLAADGDKGWFCAVNGTEWEVFLGTRISATEIGRTTVMASSNADALVSFTVAPEVFATVPGALFSAPAFRAYRNTSAQTPTSNTMTKVQFNAETFDTAGCFDSTTNYRFTPTVPGYYAVQWSVSLYSGDASLNTASTNLYKNGSVNATVNIPTPDAGGVSTCSGAGSALVYLNGTTDYLEVFAYGLFTDTLYIQDDASLTYFSGSLAQPG